MFHVYFISPKVHLLALHISSCGSLDRIRKQWSHCGKLCRMRCQCFLMCVLVCNGVCSVRSPNEVVERSYDRGLRFDCLPGGRQSYWISLRTKWTKVHLCPDGQIVCWSLGAVCFGRDQLPPSVLLVVFWSTVSCMSLCFRPFIFVLVFVSEVGRLVVIVVVVVVLVIGSGLSVILCILHGIQCHLFWHLAWFCCSVWGTCVFGKRSLLSFVRLRGVPFLSYRGVYQMERLN